MTTFLVYNKRTGERICEAANLKDAQMMVDFDPNQREIRKSKKVLPDQVVEVSFTQLPNDKQFKAQKILPDREAVPFRP